MALPGFLLTETVQVARFTPGPAWAAPVTRRAHVQEGRKLVRGDSGTTAEASLNVFLRPDLDVTVGSQFTVRGQACTAVSVDVNTTKGLAAQADHLDVWCELNTLLPSTTVTVTRGAPTLDDFGDPVDSTTVVAANLPAQLVETNSTRKDRADQRGGIVEDVTIRLATGATIVEGDRLTDDTTGAVYQTVGVIYPPRPTGTLTADTDTRVLARRVAASSAPPA